MARPPMTPRERLEARRASRTRYQSARRGAGIRRDVYLSDRALEDLQVIRSTWGIDSDTLAINIAIKYLAHATRVGLKRLTVLDG